MAVRTGVWLVGARGSIATTAIVGAAAIGAGLVPAMGCVTALPDFGAARLPDMPDLVFGGHDSAQVTLPERAEQLARSGLIPASLLNSVRAALLAAEEEIQQPEDAAHPGRMVAKMVQDITDFQRRRQLDQVVVINVGPPEPPVRPHPAHATMDSVSVALDLLPPSSLYAFAAISARFAFVDLTASTGARLPGLDELARRNGVPYAGSDVKTGQALVKSVLAPMFMQRVLNVRSWSGTFLTGGDDGAVLTTPGPASAWATSRRRVTEETLGHPVEGRVTLDYLPSAGDRTTAWDHIGFEGFLGAPMTLQVVWHGADAAMAAPLLLDLARLMAAAQRSGRAGAVPELAFFFNDPLGTSEHRLGVQYEMLRSWATALGASPI